MAASVHQQDDRHPAEVHGSAAQEAAANAAERRYLRAKGKSLVRVSKGESSGGESSGGKSSEGEWGYTSLCVSS